MYPAGFDFENISRSQKPELCIYEQKNILLARMWIKTWLLKQRRCHTDGSSGGFKCGFLSPQRKAFHALMLSPHSDNESEW